MKIKEVWNPFILSGQMLVALAMGLWAVKSQQYIWIPFSIIYAWQAGWGVKLEVEIKRLKEEGEL